MIVLVIIILILFLLFVGGTTLYLYQKGIVGTSDVNNLLPSPLDQFTLTEKHNITPHIGNLFNEELRLEECAVKCLETDDCISFVYNNDNGKCSGKSDNLIVPSISNDTYTLESPVIDPILDSWTPMVGKTSINPDVFTITDTPEVCAYKCKNESNCGAFVYKDGECYGKRLDGGKIYHVPGTGFKLYSKPGITPEPLTEDVIQSMYGNIM